MDFEKVEEIIKKVFRKVHLNVLSEILYVVFLSFCYTCNIFLHS